MSYRVNLTQSMVTCPPAWQRFVDTELMSGPRDRYGDIKVEYINEKLKTYGARFDPGSSSRQTAVVFDSEANKAFWLLRWS